MNRGIKYGIVFIVLGIVFYNAVFFKKLTELKKEVGVFNSDAFVDEIWNNKLDAQIAQALTLEDLIKAVNQDKEAALAKYSHALAIGNYRYALIQLDAEVKDVNEDELVVATQNTDSSRSMILATEFIYGNAVRDATGLVDVKDFPNTSDLNSISESFNKRIRKNVIALFRKNVKKGDKIQLIGAATLNKEHLKWDGMEIIPVQIKILH